MSLSTRLERVLWTIGLASLGCSLFIALQAQHYRAHAADISNPATESKPDVSDKVIGKLEIPALRLSAAVLADYDPDSLLKGIGHIRGTAQPGGLGTVGLAGHRDTFFRPLRRISPHMDIRLTDRTGTYHYSVDSTEIVTPDRVDVLAITTRPELALITCFPFDYIGAAPRRFIVHAHLLSASPDIRFSQP
jgi:sortase A